MPVLSPLPYKWPPHALSQKILAQPLYFLNYVAAVGCANPSGLAPGVWLRRDGNHALLGCNTTGNTWRITCSGSEWRGQTRVNCSQSASSSSAAAFPLDGMTGWDLSQFFAHEAFPLSKTLNIHCTLVLITDIAYA